MPAITKQNAIGTGMPIEAEYGGTGTNTLTNHGILVGSGTSPINALAVGANGQVLIGATGADPSFGTLTSAGGTITFISGAGTLNLEAGGGVVATTYATDAGNGVPAAGILTVAGGSNLNTSGAGSTITVNLDNSPSVTGSITAGTGLTVTTGDAAISAGNLTLPVTNAAGTEGIVTVGGTRWISNYGTGNTFTGEDSGNTTLTVGSAIYNVGIGIGVLGSLTTGNRNAGVGRNVFSALTEGTYNTAAGNSGMAALTTGDFNTAIGSGSLDELTTTDRNTAVGSGSLGNVVTGSYNVALGNNAGFSLTTNDSDNICIMNLGTVGDNNTLRLGTQGNGDGQIDKSFIAGIYNTTPAGGVDQAVIIDSNGQLGASNELVLANQPAFLAYLGASVANATGNGTTWQLGTTTALTEVFDQGSDFNTNGTFTAPVTGRYNLSASIALDAITNATSAYIEIVTSNRTYRTTYCSPSSVMDGGDQAGFVITVLADMDAADTAVVNIYSTGEGADNETVLGAATLSSYFSGSLAC